ncbi:MAG TPA: 50S ribosomal protein L10 [Ktedonobacterales bacterium]|nr:50S ribosomal protein L10 [Ktedonobacterales bacterium]
MPTPGKAAIIREMVEKLTRARGSVLLKTDGLTVAEIQDFRRKLSATGVELFIVKNTLLRIAAEQANYSDLSAILRGPTAIAIGYGDEVTPAKTIADYLRTAKTGKPLSIKAGILERAPITTKQVEDLAKIPPRNQLRAEVVGSLQGPLSQTYSIVSAPLRDLVFTLEARIHQLGGDASAA